MFAGKKSAQIREILISESAWEEMTCLFAPSLGLRRWRESNDSQGTMHLIHFLAAKFAGAKKGTPILYTENSVDFNFCDKFLRVNNSNTPYFDPLGMSHRISTHPHSNVATARKKTFSDKWKAGVFTKKDGNEYFQFEDDYISILTKNMAKQGRFTKINPEELACWLYREYDFENDDDIDNVVSKMKSDFNFDEEEWQALFADKNAVTSSKLEQWVKYNNKNDSNVIIDILTRDVDGFNIYNTLMAIREVEEMPIVSPDQIIDAMHKLNCKQVVLQGPPGTGKTYLAKQTAMQIIQTDLTTCRSNLSSVAPDKYWGILQFHPSYGYEDFIQRMVPQQKTGEAMHIEIVDMPFIIACKTAESIKPKPFVLIVDEMNRADLQKVFGELMYALEYREEPLTLQYSREPLLIPDNLYVIGTMNTADSSVVQVDYAIRRRFVFFDVPPDSQVISQSIEDEQTKKVAIELFKATNAACNNHPRFSIGHSYFLHADLAGLVNSFVYQVLPVLRSYQENGVISEEMAVYLSGWDAEPISTRPSRPDVLIETLMSWAKTYE
ncbi:AAA family ATPase [Citrobacter freundii]|uniref:McrB family protein n=1 Tax=Citrobacter freundii TaxID=546 RepID=UPI00374FB306